MSLSAGVPYAPDAPPSAPGLSGQAPGPGELAPDPIAGGENRPIPNYPDLNAMVMQKVLSHDHVAAYLERGYDMVSGFVHRLQDVAHLRTPEQLMRSLGLAYEESPFNERDETVHVLRWRVHTVGLYRTPLGGPTEEVMRSVPGGWVIERPPFGGTGYAPSFGEAIPEYKVDSHRLPHSTEMYRIDRSGDATFVAVYNADEQRWIPASA